MHEKATTSTTCSDSGSADSGALATFSTDLKLPGFRKGKVRDTYTLPGQGKDGLDAILMVASDRISAFDVVMPTPITGKGRVLTSIAAFWLRWIESQGLSRTHLLSTDHRLVPDDALTESTTREHLIGRVTIGKRCKVVPVECVVRGYLEGSGWKDYQATGSICGVSLPEGLTQCAELDEPIFTPATKAEEGHDENIGFESAVASLKGFVDGVSAESLMSTLRDRSLKIYKAARDYARARGIILADTKFEFGLEIDNQGNVISTDPILIDEALTPDSSRFWPADDYEPGRAQRSFDKQFVREYLQNLVDQGKWDKTDPGPSLPDEVVRGTLDRYTQAAALLTGG